MDNLTVKVIARIYTDFGEKFGVPRQSGLVPELTGKIIFEPEYRVPEALSGIDRGLFVAVAFVGIFGITQE